ncbi:MAG: spermidine synthase [Sphingomonadales bacterium]|nr:spermidine synthase [Sphingomonadales bacterium]
MEPHECIGTAMVPGGVELRLIRHGGNFTIAMGDNDLMSTRVSGSEAALATMTSARLGSRRGSEWLIGGYGMGFTLRAALATLEDDACVTVAELVPEIIEWARGPMRALTAGCLADARVQLVGQDVTTLIGAATAAYDAILLDVDNGPEGLSCASNDFLYSSAGLAAARHALKPGGILAIWSAFSDARFAARLEASGFDVAEVNVSDGPKAGGDMHVLWFARKSAPEA